MTASTDLDALEDLLDAERHLLLSGKVDGLADLAERKERLIASLTVSGRGDAAALARLDPALRRNGRLLAAAAQGLRDAGSRLRHLRGDPELVTYDDKGRRATVDATTPTVVRNA